jgi:PKD repeat protein
LLEGETSMVVEKNLLKRSFAVLIAASMFVGLLVIDSDNAAALPTDAWIVGNVTDGVDPVPNSYVKVMLFISNGLDINYTFTDVNGDYNVGVPGGFDYVVFVANGSYYMSMQPVSILTGETIEVDFELEEVTDPTDVTIMGYVKDEFGVAITDGHVLGLVNDPMGGDTPHYANVTVPNGAGYFEVNVIPGPAGGGAVLMDYPGYSMVENDTDSPLLSGESYWFNITLEPEVSIDDAVLYGYVTDFSTGLPLALAMISAEIENKYLGERYSNYTFTDVDGYFEMNVTNGSAQLTFSKGGYAMKMYDRVEILPSDMLLFDEALVPTNCVVRGNVTDLKTDTPLVFANVFMMDTFGNFSSTITNDTGFYELRCVDGEEIIVMAQVEGYSRNYTILTLSPGDEVWQDFGLWPVSCWIEGQVSDALTDTPIGGARISVSSISPEYWDEEWTDGTGYYNISLIPGDYQVYVDAPDYRSNLSMVNVPDETAVVHNVDLLPEELPETCRLYGWVNDSESATGIDQAEVKVQLSDRSYYKDTKTDSDGYYEIFVPPMILMYGVTASQHFPDFGVLDASSDPEIRMDFLLVPDPLPPNWTYNQAPVDNITWINPTVIDAEIEDPNLREITVMQLMFWRIGGSWEYFYVVDMKSTSFDPFSQSDEVNCTQDGDNYTISEKWNATAQAGWLSDGVDSMYLMAYEQWWNDEHYYVLMGNYTNSTYTDRGCTAVFDYDTGEVLLFMLDEVEGQVMVDDDPTATFDPAVLAIAFDVDDWMTRTWTWGVKSGHPMSVLDLTLQGDSTVPSGDYKTWFMASDFGGQGVPIDFVNLTVDNDPPVADAGDDWTQVMSTTATFNGSASSDNVGIASYVWDFDDDGSPVHLIGEVVDHEFISPGMCVLTLTVTDGAGHESSDTVTVTVVDDILPIANAGLDLSVPSGSTVTFDGGLSSDNVDIVSYVWTFEDDGLQTLTGETVSHAFNDIGEIIVTLNVTDAGGNYDTDQLVITVFDATDPVADAGPDQTVEAGDEVTFDGIGSSDNVAVVSWVWTFVDDGDDETLSGVSPTYTFENSGVFVVTLTVEDAAGNSDEDTVTIRVNSPPVANAGSDFTVKVGATVIFDGSDSSDDVLVENYTWTFIYDNEVQELYGVAPSFTFEAAGNYTVTLTVEDASGLTDTDTVVVNVGEDGGTAEDKSFLEEYWWLLVVVGVIVAGAVAAAALMKSKKGPKGESPASPPEEMEDLPPPPDDGEL